MRVWIVNHYAQMPSESGITRHHALSRPLVERGHEVTIISAGFHHPTRTSMLEPGERLRVDAADGVTFVRLRTPPYKDNGLARIMNMVSFGRQVRRERALRALPRPDVIVGSSPHLFAPWAAASLARAFGVPFVMEARDLLPEDYVATGAFSRHHPAVLAMARLERSLYRRARRIITVVPRGADYFAACGVPRERIVWLPNGVDLSLVPPPAPPPPRDRLEVVYCGALGLKNDMGAVLEAAQRLQADGWGDRLLIKLVGDGPEKPDLQRRAEQMKLTNLLFFDLVPKAEIYKIMGEADIALVHFMLLAHFKKYGVSPNKVFDYMAAARPVLFPAGLPDDPITLAHAGLTVDSKNPEAIAAGLRELAELSPQERWEMGLRGRRFVEEHHSFALLSRKFEELLLEVIAEAS